MKLVSLPFILVMFGVFIVDQISKWLAIQYLKPLIYVPILPFFYLTYTENTGGTFGILPGRNYLFIGLNILVLIILFRELNKEYLRDKKMLVALICGGALGNLFDRIFRGKVIDFFDLRVWPVFNVADSSIFVAMVLLVTSFLFSKKK